MKLDIDSNWLLQMAEREDNRIISVGGLVALVENSNEGQILHGEMVSRTLAEIGIGQTESLIEVPAEILTALIPMRDLRAVFIRRELTEFVKGGSSVGCYGPKSSLPLRPVLVDIEVPGSTGVLKRVGTPVPGTGNRLRLPFELPGKSGPVHDSHLDDYTKRMFATNEHKAWDLARPGEDRGVFGSYMTNAAEPISTPNMGEALKLMDKLLKERRAEEFAESVKKWAESPDMVLHFAGGIATDKVKDTIARILEKYPGHKGKLRRNGWLNPDSLMMIDEAELQPLYRWASGGGLEEKIMTNSHLKSYGKKRIPNKKAKQTWYYQQNSNTGSLRLVLDRHRDGQLHRYVLELLPSDLHHAKVPARRIIAEAWWRLRWENRLK